MSNDNRLPKEVWSRIEKLDLGPIIRTLMHKKDGNGWPLEKTLVAVRWYRRFLLLNFKYPDTPIVPTLDIDEVWHTHILDTKKYHRDCDEMFGYYLHHFPYFGMGGDDDAAALKDAAEKTGTLYVLEFGEAPHPGDRVKTCSTCR